jgi:hypothetical protein
MSEEGENEDDKWITVTGRGKTKKLLKPKLKPTLHNAFAILSQPNDLSSYNLSGPPLQMNDDKTILPPDRREHRRQCKIARRQHIKQTLRRLRDGDNLFLDNSITLAEDKGTSLAKADENNKKRMAINTAHTKHGTTSIGFAQRGRNAAYNLGSAFNRTIKKINKNKHVSFATHNRVHQYSSNEQPIMVTYDSGADGHYISKKDRRKAGLPILRTSTQKVGVANGGTSKAKYVTQLPFRQLSAQATQAHTFRDFASSLMSVGKTADDGTVSVFTKEGVNIFKEEDVLITCKGEPILIGLRDSHGQYRIPLVQQRGQWQPQCPSKQARKTLRQANSVYDLPSTKHAIKWMHAVCGYPVKSTWLKAIKAGNYVGSPMLNERNVQKY